MSSFARPSKLETALDQLAAFAARGIRPTLLAGGTDWMVEQHLVPTGAPPREIGTVLDTTALVELRRIDAITLADGRRGYEIGAGVPYLAFRRDPALVRDVPILGAMAREVGAIQIQARGTLGGNLATGSPAADGVPVLMALDASVLLASRRGKREVTAQGFFTGYKRNVMTPDEMITGVRFATPPPHWYWRKVGTRMAQSIAKVALAATARTEGGIVRDVHFGMASVAPTTATLPRVRAVLVGQRTTDVAPDAIAKALAADIAPIDDVRSTRAYRLHVAQRLVERFVATLRDGAL